MEKYQVNNDTEVSLFKDIRPVLKEFSSYNHGIVSQNAFENIISYLKSQKLESHFSKIIGYEEIGYDQQKPDPTGLLACIKHLTNSESGSVVYIGDHETDIQCAYLANQRLKENGSNLHVFSIEALYGLTVNTENWEYEPDFEAQDPSDIALIVKKLAV